MFKAQYLWLSSNEGEDIYGYNDFLKKIGIPELGTKSKK